MTTFETLIVFAREPQLGAVKQRLAADTDARFALAAYERLLERALRTARAWQRHGSARHGEDGFGEVGVAVPAVAQRRIVVAALQAGMDGRLAQWCRHTGSVLLPQQGCDLGARMRHAIESALDAGASRVVLVGCDCPGLAMAHHLQAFAALRTSEVVLAPTYDGGYCLVGMRSPVAAIFEGIDWGTSEVLRQTLACAASLSVHRLAMQHDIDHIADWQRWCAERKLAHRPESEWFDDRS